MARVRGVRRPEEDLIALQLPFERTMRGFEPRQVLDHIESLEGHLGVVANDRDAALAQLAALTGVLEQMRCESSLSAELRRERDEAAAQTERLRRSPVTAASGRIQQMLQLAEDEAAEVLDRARVEADRLLGETAQRCARLETEAQERIEAARAEAAGRIRDEEEQSRARLAVLLRVAGAQARERVADAQRQLAELAERRTEVERAVDDLAEVSAALDERLASAQHLLDEAFTQLDPAEGDDWAPVPTQRDTSRPLTPTGANGRRPATD